MQKFKKYISKDSNMSNGNCSCEKEVTESEFMVRVNVVIAYKMEIKDGMSG